MPTVIIEPNATIFVTGVNGLIGSHLVDQLMSKGYNVRGAVRDVNKCKWLKEYFDEKFKTTKLDLVEVSDMTANGCYDEVVKGTSGFIHTASPVGTEDNLQNALNIGCKAALNALTACAKTPSIKCLVNTSSSTAASLPRIGLDKPYPIDEKTFNDETLAKAETEQSPRNIDIYAASKSETEKFMWKWMDENKPNFTFNSILPNANFGPVLLPTQQGFPSTIFWARSAFTGESFSFISAAVPPQWFISLRDTALLHISALIHEDVAGERLFGYAGRWDFNDLLRVYREIFPDREFPADVVQGRDEVVPPTERALEVLRWVKGEGWDGLEETVKEMCKDW